MEENLASVVFLTPPLMVELSPLAMWLVPPVTDDRGPCLGFESFGGATKRTENYGSPP